MCSFYLSTASNPIKFDDDNDLSTEPGTEDHPRLCEASPQNQTVEASEGASVTFSACVNVTAISSKLHLCDWYDLRHSISDVMVMYGKLSDGKYRVELTVQRVTRNHFGTHVVKVTFKNTNEEIMRVYLTISKEESSRPSVVVAASVSTALIVVIGIICFLVRTIGKRKQTYTINKKIYTLTKLFQCFRKTSQHASFSMNDFNHYDTVDDVVVNANAEDAGASTISEVPEVKDNLVLQSPQTPYESGKLKEISNGIYITVLDDNSGYITPKDVKRSSKLKKKSLSLQRDRNLQKTRYRRERSRSLESLDNELGDTSPADHHYCNCEPFRKKAEPRLISVKHRGESKKSATLDPNYSLDCKPSRGHNSKLEDTYCGTKYAGKCQKYVNIREDLEKYWENFKNVNKNMDRKKSLRKEVNGKTE
ncbi:hypothetical protein Bpfe_003662 [Biomphalaria pfeifferi]|uniref:Uncharacterized protein n=1 Tax=Biomphalaria pfeifferi TaxID=112525 RepID=A0AAD8C5M3_BIOPF|nr:hypothetical protein Bpfe_003662 [Biomphalaria pfeifferi]